LYSQLIGKQRSGGATKSYHDPISIHKPWVEVYACNTSYVVGIGRRIMVPGWPGQKAKCYLKYLKNNLRQKGLEIYFKGRALARS
jgi:hypothetical protein